MRKKHEPTFFFDEHSLVSWEQLEARGIAWGGQANLRGRVCFLTIQRLSPMPWQVAQEKTLYQRLSQLLCDHRLALTSDDPLAQESALNILQALIHEELQKVWTPIAPVGPQSAGDAPWQPPQSSGSVWEQR